MSGNVQDCLCYLADEWRARARRFIEEAEQARRPAELVRLTAMASTLEWAAGDLAWIARSPRMAELLRAAGKDEPKPSAG